MQTLNSLVTHRQGQASIKKYEEKYFTGSSAFPTTSRRQIWNRNCSYSPCGPCPTRRGRFYARWPGCQSMPGMRWSTSSTPYIPWWVWGTLELLVHNLQVADIGGTLGLFLGFSFLGLFDALVKISSSAVKFFIEIPSLARNIEV